MVVKPKLPLASLRLRHDEPELFVTSQWARTAKKTTHFLLFRLLLGALYIGILSWSWSGSFRHSGYQFWWIYMTSWGIFICTVSTVYSAVLTTLYHFNLINLTSHSASYKVYWLLSSTSTVLAFMITVVYWSILFNGTTSSVDVMVHGTNSLGMLIELLMVRHPVYLAHMIYPLGIGVLWIVFSIVYYFSGGVDARGNTFIYEVLWWKHPGKASAVAAGVFVLSFFLYIFVWIVYKIRKRVYKRLWNVDPKPIQPIV